MSELDFLIKLLSPKICRNGIVGDGDCFFHAFEYAIGTCPLIPYNMRNRKLTIKEKQDYIKSNVYRKTRADVLKQIISKKEKELDVLLKSTSKDVSKEIERLISETKTFSTFGNSYDYADDFIIKQTAVHKKKSFIDCTRE